MRVRRVFALTVRATSFAFGGCAAANNVMSSKDIAG